MKRILTLLVALLLLVSVCGCQRQEAEYVPTGNALVMDDGSTVDTRPTEAQEADLELQLVYNPDNPLNPLLNGDYTNRALQSLLYQGLFSVDRSYQVEPVLCKSFSVTDDMMTYRFYLEDACFSDGTRLTEEDVAASLNAARESEYYSGRFQYVSSIEVSPTGGVTISLKTPYENFPILLDVPILRASQLELENPVGTGPYVFEQGAGDARMRLNTNWWCAEEAELLFQSQVISLLTEKDNTKIRDAFEFADLNLVCTNPASDKYADYRGDYELWDCENGIFVYLGCNMGSNVFYDSTVRSALTYAIDRQKLADTYYRGFGLAASLPASPKSPWYDETLAQRYAYDSDRFVKALEESGMLETPFPLVLLVNKDDTLRLRVARDIGEMLTECGLSVEMKEVSTTEYQEALLYREYDLYVGQTRLSANMDLSQFFSEYGNLSKGAIDDSSLYALCLESLANSGNYYNLHKQIMEDGRICPVLFCGYAVYATRGVLSDLEPARDNIFWYSLGKNMESARIGG